jgi:hypothetical protein
MVALGAGLPCVPSGSTITFRPPRFLNVIGTLTDTISITPPS